MRTYLYYKAYSEAKGMKKNKIFAVLTTSALLLAACSNGDNSSSSGQKGQPEERTN